MASDDNLFSFIFFITVFTRVNSAISHLKEDKIKNELYRKKKIAFKTPCILNNAKKMAYNLHKLSDNV